MRRVVYVMSGKAHLPYLIVSLYTLRQHWKGAVDIYAWSDSHDIVKELASDSRIASYCHLADPEYRGKNAQFIHKQHIMQSLASHDVGLYLDADTMICGDVHPLLDVGETIGFVATQFNNWPTNGGMIKKRVERLRGRDPDIDEIVDALIEYPYPSVNGGVFACSPQSNVLQQWIDWTWMYRDIFIADETVLHALVHKYHPRSMVVWRKGEFNSSPKFFSLDERMIKVWHFHGDCNVKMFENKQGEMVPKSKKGIELWWPVYQECLRENIGNIQDWIDGVGNKHIRRLETSHG